jgi:hypothetical protein
MPTIAGSVPWRSRHVAPRWYTDPYLAALGLTMASGAVVLFEPAPIDLAIVILLVWGAIAGKLRLQPVHQIPIFLLSAFAIANLMSLWDPLNLIRGLWFTAITYYLMGSMVLFLGVTSAMGRRAFDAILSGYIAGAVLNIVLAVGGYFGLLPGREYFLLYGRPKGLFKDPNVYAPYIVPVAVFALVRLLTKGLSWRQQVAWSFILGTCVTGVFLSFSRASWANCVISLAIVFGFSILHSEVRQIVRKLRLAVLAFMLAAGVLLLAINVPQVNRMLQIRLGSGGLQSYDRIRFYTHSRAIESMVDRPLGMGSGQSEAVFNYATHSTYLRVASENGFLGALSLILLFALSLYRSTRLAFSTRDPYLRQIFAVISACLVGQFINCAVIDSLHWRHLWMLLGLSWAVPRESIAHPVSALRVSFASSRSRTWPRIARNPSTL